MNTSLKVTACDDCNIYGFSYKFANVSENFKEAQNKCKDLGGNLAKSLTEYIFKILNNCCSTQQHYWIGLVNDKNCDSNDKNRYHWIGDTDQCVNIEPLNLTRRDNYACQAVAIQVNGSNNTLPQAQLSNCTNAQRFICQIPLPSPTRFISTPSAFNEQTEIMDGNPLVIGLIVGIPCLVVLMLLVVLYLWRYKNLTLNSICRSSDQKLTSFSQKAASKHDTSNSQ